MLRAAFTFTVFTCLTALSVFLAKTSEQSCLARGAYTQASYFADLVVIAFLVGVIGTLWATVMDIIEWVES